MKTLRCTPLRKVCPCGIGHSALFWLFVCLAVAGCGGTPTPPGQRSNGTANGSRTRKESADSSVAAKEPGAEQRKKSADFSLTAEELQAEYQRDEQAAEKKYKGKIIELSGVVKAVYNDAPGIIGLVAAKRTLGFPCVMIEKEPWARVAPGQTVKLRGPWAPYGEHPALYDCVIVEAGPNPAVVLTAAKLADEYAADPDGVTKKYSGKPIILSGEVVENKNDDKGRIVRLKATKKVRIELGYGPAFEKRGAKLMVGQTVKVFGELTEFNFTKDSISLTNPFPITK